MKKENICLYIEEDFEIDGDINKDVWSKAHWSNRFVDVIGNVPSVYDTKAAMLYSDKYLYFAFYGESPYPKASMKNKNDLLWFDNDIEVFIAGDDTYYELQVNAYNTIYEAFYIWHDAYVKNPMYRKDPRFDIVENEARVFGGNHDRKGLDFWKGSHPRGNRYAFLNYHVDGLETKVHVDGVLNDDSKTSKAVNYEIKIPWESLKDITNGKNSPPQDGETMQIFLARYENLRINGEITPVGWSWDYIGSDDNHYPEKFTKVTFRK